VAINRHGQLALIKEVLAGTLPACPDDHTKGPHLQRASEKGSWCWNWDKFVSFWDTGVPAYRVLVKGNTKLTFFAFSALPGATCPGAGECLKWCYSFEAWHHSAALLRQLQNTVLIQRQSQYIIDAWHALPYGHTVRLYVDGDFDSLATMRFWFDLVASRPDLTVYGYSKSWQLFLDYAKAGIPFPTNYSLNLSSGSIYERIPAMRQAMDSLSIVRGDFIAVNPGITGRAPDRRIDPAKWAKWASACKAAAKVLGHAKSFVCPGKCYDCLPNGEHACGSDRFKGIAVVIGLH
jgi:hypothetical protein